MRYITIFVASLLIQSPREGEFKISANSELVLLDVGITDRHGLPVSNLTKDDFKVFDNGKLQAITHFANDDVPVTVGLVVDNSGSMRPKKPEVISAGLAFIKQSNPDDEVFVTHFNDHVTLSLPPSLRFTSNTNELRDALLSGQPEGRTALYDAIVTSLDHLASGTRDKKTLLLVSDGGDNASRHKFEDVMSAVRQSRATIYTVGIFDEDDPDRNPGLLRRLATISGGEAFFPQQIDEIVGICKQIAKDIRERYTIGYVPPRINQSSSLRSIKVVTTPTNRGRLVVHVRTSYLLPELNAERE